MPLEAVEARRLYRQVADQLRSLIDSGEYAVGSRLPTERELAEQLKVSRPTVREALIALEVEGSLRIRVGSGGVMLQHYSPYKVAENFNVLAALAPGRVDLGVGKAPGGLPLSTRALQLGLDQQEKGSFAEQLAQLDRWIRPENHSAEEAVRATPLPPVPAQGFLLGASTESALLAASLDWHFVFAAHLNGDPELLREVVSTWRKNSAREVIVAVQAIIAPTQVEAEALAQKVEVWGVELANGQRVTVASEDQAYAFARQDGSEPVRIARRAQSLLVGTAESVLEQLNALHAPWAIDEFIIDTPVAEGATRVQSLRLLAEARLNREVTV